MLQLDHKASKVVFLRIHLFHYNLKTYYLTIEKFLYKKG